MPHAVRMFAWLSYGSLGLGLVSSFVDLPSTMAALGQDLDALGGLAFVIPVLVVSFFIPVLLVWLASSRGQSWARYAFAILFVAGLALTFTDTTVLRLGGVTRIAIFASGILIQAAGLFYVFSSGAKPWYDRTPSCAV